MKGRIAATISGFNEYVQTLRDDPERGEILLSLTQFDNRVNSVYTGVPLAEVPELDTTSYVIGGMTALYDAVGRTVRKVEKIAKSGDKVLVIVMTDGGENSSKEYTQQAILDMFRQKREQGWEFVFLGAGEESWSAGMSLGFDHAHTVFYGNSEHAHERTYASLGALTSDLSRSVPVAASVSFQNTKAGMEDESGASKLWSPENEPPTEAKVPKIKTGGKEKT
jgi:uncharacterized protein YegL